MRILMLQEDLFRYLQYVVTSHARSGIEPEEALSLHYLQLAVKSARSVDEQQVAKVGISGSGDASVSVKPKSMADLMPLQEVEYPKPPVGVTEGD